MTHEELTVPAVHRRRLLTGAVLAGAAGVAAIGATSSPTQAHAADGDQLVVGANNQAAATTVLTLSPAGAAAALTLVNTNGPSLRLQSVGADFAGPLRIGDIVNTDAGPVVGVNHGAGAEVDFLVTGNDLDRMPVPTAIDPERLLDTRRASGRTNIVRQSSSTALTAAGKLRAGQWIDIAVGAAGGELELAAIFATAAVISPEKNGYLIVYPPRTPVPGTSNINYRAGESLANAAFVGLGTHDRDYVIRLWTSQTTHLLFDLSGAVVGASTSAGTRPAANRRAERQAKQLARIRQSLRHS